MDKAKRGKMLSTLALSTVIGAFLGFLYDYVSLGAAFGLVGGIILTKTNKMKPKPIRIKVHDYR